MIPHDLLTDSWTVAGRKRFLHKFIAGIRNRFDLTDPRVEIRHPQRGADKIAMIRPASDRQLVRCRTVATLNAGGGDDPGAGSIGGASQTPSPMTLAATPPAATPQLPSAAGPGPAEHNIERRAA